MISRVRNKFFIATSFIALIGVSGAGFAQAASSPSSADKTSTAPVPDAGIADIVVTAEKRSVSQQRSPSAITAVSGAALEARGIDNIQQAQVLAPSVHLGQEGLSTQAFIRGVGISLDSVNIEPQVAMNYNGVYVPREATGGVNLFDITSVEVLPGPQGTLYGRSATGGVINASYHRPGDRLGGDISFETGNYGLAHVTGAIDLPGSSSALFRLAGTYNRENGYMRSGSGSEDDLGVRASTILKPVDRLSIYLWGEYVQHRGSIPNAVNLPLLNPKDPYNDFLPACCQPFGQVTVLPLHQNVYSAGGEIAYNDNGYTLTYIPGYVRAITRDGEWLTALKLTLHDSVTVESNELKLSTPSSSRLQGLAGLYQYNQTYRDYLFQFPTGNPYNIPFSREYGLAAYAQGIYSITDHVRLTLGGRYSSTKRRANGLEYLGAGFPTPPYAFAATYNHFDWKVGIETDVGARSLAYAAIQTGYNPGTFNTSPSLPLLPRGFLPTKLTSYTVGIKNSLFNNRVRLNVEGYYYDYRDLLVSAFNTLTGQQTVQNAKKVQIYGVQIDSRFAITRLTEIYASGNYLHAENTDFIIPEFMAPSLNLNGKAPPYSPRITLNIGGKQTFELGNGATVAAQVDSHHESSTHSQFDQAAGTFIEGYWKTDFTLTFTPRSKAFLISAFVRNIENTAHIATAGSGGIPNPAAGILERPRTYGVRASYKF